MDRVIPNRYVDVSAFYIYISILLVVISRMYTILITTQVKCSIRNSHAILAVQAVILTVYGIGAACNHQVILGHDSMSRVILDRQASSAIKCEITFGKYHSVHIIVIRLDVVSGYRKTVPCPFRQRNKYLVSVLCIYSRIVRSRDRYSVKYKLNLIVIARIHHDGAVCECP